nr:MAG TPA: protein of unknown function (DUF5323) [Caudoviricetes sp.]
MFLHLQCSSRANHKVTKEMNRSRNKVKIF